MMKFRLSFYNKLGIDSATNVPNTFNYHSATNVPNTFSYHSATNALAGYNRTEVVFYFLASE